MHEVTTESETHDISRDEVIDRAIEVLEQLRTEDQQATAETMAGFEVCIVRHSEEQDGFSLQSIGSASGQMKQAMFEHHFQEARASLPMHVRALIDVLIGDDDDEDESETEQTANG